MSLTTRVSPYVTHKHAHKHTQTQTHTHTHIYTHMHTHTHTHMHAHAHKHAHKHTHKHKHIHIHAHTHTYTQQPHSIMCTLRYTIVHGTDWNTLLLHLVSGSKHFQCRRCSSYILSGCALSLYNTDWYTRMDHFQLQKQHF